MNKRNNEIKKKTNEKTMEKTKMKTNFAYFKFLNSLIEFLETASECDIR